MELKNICPCAERGHYVQQRQLQLLQVVWWKIQLRLNVKFGLSRYLRWRRSSVSGSRSAARVKWSVWFAGSCRTGVVPDCCGSDGAEPENNTFDLYVDLRSSCRPEAAGAVVSEGASWVGTGSWSGSRFSGHVQLVGGQRVEPEHAGGIIYISSGFLNVSQSLGRSWELLPRRRAGESWFYSCFSFSSPDFLPGSQFFCISCDLWQKCSPVLILVSTACFWQRAAWSLRCCCTLSSPESERRAEERRRNVLSKM